MSNVLKVTCLDLETTNKVPECAELITAFLRTRNIKTWEIIDEIYLTFKPKFYDYGAFETHKISKEQSDYHADRWVSFHELLLYMHKHRDGLFCCHANHLVFGSYGYYDFQVLKQVAFTRSLFYKADTYQWFQKMFKKERFISTHTMVKRLIPIRLTRNIEDEDAAYSLKNIANHFGFKFTPHDCKEDVGVTEKILKECLEVTTINNYEDLLNAGSYLRKGEKNAYGQYAIC